MQAVGEVRFTRKGNILYAIALGRPEDELRLTSLAGKKATEVEMLGLNEATRFITLECKFRSMAKRKLAPAFFPPSSAYGLCEEPQRGRHLRRDCRHPGQFH